MFETILQKRLKRISGKQNVVVIPHGVQNYAYIPRKYEARKRLGLPQKKFLIVSFGFIAWYKGSDWLVEAYKQLAKEKDAKNVQLILAGGPNTNHVNQAYYETYLRKLLLTAQNTNITITGFVPEDKISLYYQAADILVFPYRTLISASGPMSLAFSFKKPILLSSSMQDILQTADIKAIFQRFKMKKEHLFFSSQKDFIEKIKRVQKNVKLKRQLAAFSHQVAIARNWNTIAARYYAELF